MGSLQDSSTSALLDGRYQLLDCVGQGGMAQVYRAEDVVLGRIVAIKMMRADADALASPARARNEMTVLAGLNHPSLVKLLDGSIAPGRPAYLVMEFVEGETLAQCVASGPLSSADAAHLGSELASALHTVHEAGIVHRDVKPSNILLTANALPGRRHHAKLADFGVAYLLDSTHVTSPGTVIGTAAYLAPEQVRGEAITPAVDIYALGLVLLEALTGDRAYPRAEGIGAVMARLLDPPAIPAHLGSEWTDLLTRMTATDAAARPTAIEVAHAAFGLTTAALEVPPAPSAPLASAAAGAAVAPITRVAARAAEGAEDAAPEARTLTLPLPAAPARPATTAQPAVGARVRRAKPRRKPKITALVGTAAAVALLAGGWGIWASAPGAETPDPGTSIAPITEPSIPAEPITDDEPVDVVNTDDQVPEPAAPAELISDDTDAGTPGNDDAQTQKDAEKAAQEAQRQQDKAAEEARKQAEKAQKEAEKAQKDAEKPAK